MGMFSYKCKACGHPMLSNWSTHNGNQHVPSTLWMSDCVAVLPNGSILKGEYNGYGEVDNFEEGDYGEIAAWWHRACWEACGSPDHLKAIPFSGIAAGSSDSAPDQGYFFDGGEHDMEKPDCTTFAGGSFEQYDSIQHAILAPGGVPAL